MSLQAIIEAVNQVKESTAQQRLTVCGPVNYPLYYSGCFTLKKWLDGTFASAQGGGNGRPSVLSDRTIVGHPLIEQNL